MGKHQLHLLWGGVSLVWAVYLLLNYGFSLTTAAGMDAFEVYYRSADALIHETALYNGVKGWIYLYPPLLAQLLMPLAALDNITIAINVWFGVNIALLFGTLYLLTRYTPQTWAKWIWLAPVLFIPFWQAFYLGQVTIIMLALLAWTWVAIQEDRPLLAGALLALAVWIKVFPAMLVLYFLYKRQWRLISSVIVTGLLLLVFQITISGPELMLAFVETLLTLTAGGQPAATYENLSLFAFVSRMFQENTFVIPLFESNMLFTAGRIGLSVGLLGLTLWALRRYARGASWRFDLEYGLMIITILLLGSTLWVSGLPPLLLVYVLLLRNSPHIPHFRAVFVLAGLSFVLISSYQPMVLLLLRDALDALVLSSGFFGVILLWWLTAMPLLTQADIPYVAERYIERFYTAKPVSVGVDPDDTAELKQVERL